jgi:hypothetical protein
VRERVDMSIDPSRASNEKDRRARQRVHEQLESQIRYVGPEEVPIAPIGKHVEARIHTTPNGLSVHGHKVVGINMNNIAVIATKFPRGMYSWARGNLCPLKRTSAPRS